VEAGGGGNCAGGVGVGWGEGGIRKLQGSGMGGRVGSFPTDTTWGGVGETTRNEEGVKPGWGIRGTEGGNGNKNVVFVFGRFSNGRCLALWRRLFFFHRGVSRPPPFAGGREGGDGGGVGGGGGAWCAAGKAFPRGPVQQPPGEAKDLSDDLPGLVNFFFCFPFSGKPCWFFQGFWLCRDGRIHLPTYHGVAFAVLVGLYSDRGAHQERT